MSNENLANAEDCKPLFELMNRVRDLAPWTWMEEIEVFGVQHPDTGEIGFVSIMGMAGEYYAIAAYRGAKGLYGFWHLQDVGPYMQPEDVFTTPQLQASFDDRNMLEKHDYQLIKSLGLKYRGRNAWPQFRSYKPGYAPWYVEKYEAEFLKYVLEQVLDVAPRVRQQPDILDPEGDHHYLVRVAQRTGDSLKWEDKVMPIEKPEPVELSIQVSSELFNAAEQLPREKYRMDADFFMLPSMVGERDERPYFPYVLLMVDATHDLILAAELVAPLPSLEDMWARLGPLALQQLVKIGSIPLEIRVRNNLLYGMLKPVAKPLDLKVKRAQRLPILDRARMEFESAMRHR